MQIKQIINNNVVICEDNKKNEIIVVGKGIGFNGHRGDFINKERIMKTFVPKDEKDKNVLMLMVEEIPYDVIEFGIQSTNYIREKCSKKISKKLLLPLVDHISTTIERYQQGIVIDNNLLWDIKFLYQEEYQIALDICERMNKFFNIKSDVSEASYITLHIVNSETELDLKDTYKSTEIIKLSIKTIENYFNIKLSNETIHFQRFITHLQFFATRMIQKTFLTDQDINMSSILKMQYPKEYECACLIKVRLEEQMGLYIEETECIYLTLHIARLLR